MVAPNLKKQFSGSHLLNAGHQKMCFLKISSTIYDDFSPTCPMCLALELAALFFFSLHSFRRSLRNISMLFRSKHLHVQMVLLACSLYNGDGDLLQHVGTNHNDFFKTWVPCCQAQNTLPTSYPNNPQSTTMCWLAYQIEQSSIHSGPYS